MSWPCSVSRASGWNCTPFDGIFFVAYAHDFAVFRPCGNFEAVGQGGAVDGQAVVARAVDRIGQVFKHACAVMENGGDFAVHHRLRAHDIAAERFAHGLMAEAHAP